MYEFMCMNLDMDIHFPKGIGYSFPLRACRYPTTTAGSFYKLPSGKFKHALRMGPSVRVKFFG